MDKVEIYKDRLLGMYNTMTGSETDKVFGVLANELVRVNDVFESILELVTRHGNNQTRLSKGVVKLTEDVTGMSATVEDLKKAMAIVLKSEPWGEGPKEEIILDESAEMILKAIPDSLKGKFIEVKVSDENRFSIVYSTDLRKKPEVLGYESKEAMESAYNHFLKTGELETLSGEYVKPVYVTVMELKGGMIKFE